jgi:hypothetical protein
MQVTKKMRVKKPQISLKVLVYRTNQVEDESSQVDKFHRTPTFALLRPYDIEEE